MKTLQEVIRKIEKRFNDGDYLDLVDRPEAITILGDNGPGFWMKNTYGLVHNENTSNPSRLGIQTTSYVSSSEELNKLEELDIRVYDKNKEVGFEKFDGHDGVELNPNQELMSQYAIDILGEKGIDLRRDFGFNHQEGDPFWFPAIRDDFVKNKGYFEDCGIDLDIDSRLLGVSYQPASVIQFPAEQRLDRILDVYTSLLKQE
ncbi:MAG: hypothetical protein ACMXYA_02965 [Candidatus Woesearchaeota archaeon]